MSVKIQLNSIYSKAFFCIALIFVFCNLNLWAFESKIDSLKKIKLYAANIKIGANIDSVSANKALSAVNLALALTQKYELIQPTIVDSLYKISLKNDSNLSVDKFAKILDAKYSLFININRFQRILRTEIVAVNTDTKEKSKGIGFALLNLQIQETGKILYDPILVSSSQRALAALFQDTLMYANNIGVYKVEPAAPLVVGGLYYKDSTDFSKWTLYSDKVLSSYYACESIFEAGKNASKYIVYDIATRDSIYSLNNMFAVENYNIPTPQELNTLMNFEVKYYITGELKRVSEGAEVNLYLTEIKVNDLKFIKKASKILENDKLDEYKVILTQLTKELLDIK